MNIKKFHKKPARRVKDNDAKQEILDRFEGISVEDGKVFYKDRDLTPSEAAVIVEALKGDGIQAFYDSELGIVSLSQPEGMQIFEGLEFPSEGMAATTTLSPEQGFDGVITVTNINGDLATTVKNGDKIQQDVWHPQGDGAFGNWVIDLLMKVQDCDLTQLPDYTTSQNPDEAGASFLHEGYNYNVSADDGKGQTSLDLTVSPSGGIITSQSYGNVPSVFGVSLPKQGEIITIEALRELLNKVLVSLGAQKVGDSIITDRMKHSYNKTKDNLSRFQSWLSARGIHCMNDSRVLTVMRATEGQKRKADSFGLSCKNFAGGSEFRDQ